MQSAVNQNVSILHNELVIELLHQEDCVTGVITNFDKRIITKYIIDATGPRRFAGRKLNFKEIFFSPPLISWTGISSGIEPSNLIFENDCGIFIPNKTGWSWIAPTPPNISTWTILSTKGKKNFSPPDILKKYPLIGEIRKSNVRWRLFRPVCKEGIILCGDAAGILDPAAGQGILNALYSGMKAANTIVSCLMNPDNESISLAKYDDWFYNHYVERVKKLAYYYNNLGIEVLLTP